MDKKESTKYTASITLYGQNIKITKAINDMAKIYHKDGFNHADNFPNEYLKADFLFGLYQTLVDGKCDIYKIYSGIGIPKHEIDFIYKRTLHLAHQLFLTAMQYDNGSDDE